MTDRPTIAVRIVHVWDEARRQTESFRPAGSMAALIDWTVDPLPVDAGVPDPIMRAVTTALASIGTVAFRLFFNHDLPEGLVIHPAPRAWFGRRIVERLIRTWPADIAVATTAEGASEMFFQDWYLQGQTALVLRSAALSNESTARLRRIRDWRGHGFPADARLLIAPAVDGDYILFAASHASELDEAVHAVAGELMKVGIPVSIDAPGVVDREV